MADDITGSTNSFGDRGENLSNLPVPYNSPDAISVVVESFNSFADYMEDYLEEDEETISKTSSKSFFTTLRNIFPSSKKSFTETDSDEQIEESEKELKKDSKITQEDVPTISEALVPIVQEIFSSSGNILNFFNLENNPLSKLFEIFSGFKKSSSKDDEILSTPALSNNDFNPLLLPPPGEIISGKSSPDSPLNLPPSSPLALPPPTLLDSPSPLALPPPLATEDPSKVLSDNVNEGFNNLLESPSNTTFGGFLENSLGFGDDKGSKMSFELGPLTLLAIGAIVAAVVALVPFLEKLAENAGELINWFVGDFWNQGLLPFIQAVQGPILSLSAGVSGLIDTVFPAISDLLGSVLNVLTVSITDILKTISRVAEEVLEVAGNILIRILEGIESGIIAFFEDPIAFFAKLATTLLTESIPELIGSIARLIPNTLAQIFTPRKAAQAAEQKALKNQVTPSLGNNQVIDVLKVETLQVNQIVGISSANSTAMGTPPPVSGSDATGGGQNINSATTVNVYSPSCKSVMNKS